MIDLLRSPRYGIKNERVLEAMADVPRHRFVPGVSHEEAYGDKALSIGFGQTISQPYIVALMTELLDPQPDDRVLEIGAGSGYQAAVLARLVDRVYTVEILEDLLLRTGQLVQSMGIRNVSFRRGDGYQGWPEEAPFDSAIVTCATPRLPQALIDQVKPEGGRLVVPLGRERDVQTLTLVTRDHDRISQRKVIDVRFVPMTGEAQRRGK